MTAIVRPPDSMAVTWADQSIPSARPLTTSTLESTRTRASRAARFSPAGDARREPTNKRQVPRARTSSIPAASQFSGLRFRLMSITLTRQELYNRVWAEPIDRLCKEFGLSNVGLGKACRRHNILAPPRGYCSRKRRVRKFGKCRFRAKSMAAQDFSEKVPSLLGFLKNAVKTPCLSANALYRVREIWFSFHLSAAASPMHVRSVRQSMFRSAAAHAAGDEALLSKMSRIHSLPDLFVSSNTCFAPPRVPATISP